MGIDEPTVVFVAHLDEIGFTVRAVRDDGTVEAVSAGGFFPRLWEGQAAFVHTGGAIVPGVFGYGFAAAGRIKRSEFRFLPCLKIY